jgi:hypothetical protein
MNYKIFLSAMLFHFITLTSINADEIQSALNEYIRQVKSLEISRLDGSEFEAIATIDSIGVMRYGIRCVPYLLEESEKKQHGVIVFLALGNIYSSVTYIRRNEGVYPWSGAYYTLEWYGGKELAKERFDFLYNKLKNATKEERSMILNAFASMGIYSLPFTMEKILADEDEFCDVFRETIYGTEKWSKEKIIKWWKKRKDDFILPSQNKEKFQYKPTPLVLPDSVPFTIEEKVERLYPEWKKRHIIEGIYPFQIETSRKMIILTKLIGIENTPQFRFLVDLGEDALPYLFLKLKEEKEQFTLPVIEKIMNKKLSPEEIKQHIKAAEELLNKPEPRTSCDARVDNTRW